MTSKWRKVKLALGLNRCTHVRRTSVLDDDYEELESPISSAPITHGRSKSLSFTKSFSKSSKNTCSICLATMRNGDGQAIFTAECSHSFHFQCIALNAKHGNQICPICRAKWKEIPLQAPNFNPTPRREPINWSHNNDLVTMIRRLPPRLNSHRQISPPIQPPEPAIFNDDESLDLQPPDLSNDNEHSVVKIETYTEVPQIQRSRSSDNFTVLVHLKAPSSLPNISRAPIDLVTVLDISGSMAGTKLALLKRAMGFVIQNLGPNDRLSVIVFSSTAKRLFSLRRMSESGRQHALQAVNSLIANGGTNIAEGLRKGAKVMEDRMNQNAVSSIVLLSDGQDTYTVSLSKENYDMLLPDSIHDENSSSFKIPVHAFGFGTDHDASSMHSISEISGGTFSFIETEGAIQNAFAQCIGGLLSVVVKELRLMLDCVDPKVNLCGLKTGSYVNRVMPDGRIGSIEVGDLYADEERDFLVLVNILENGTNDEITTTTLFNVRCVYNDPLTKNVVNLEGEEVKIKRPEVICGSENSVSLKVDRQKNRILVAETMAEARILAENGDLVGAGSILEKCRKNLSETFSAKCCDNLCVALDGELKEMQERMTSRQVYEASGRAYMLSGLSSHSWQRATARGDSTNGSSVGQAYQTPSMIAMVRSSQASLLGSPSVRRFLQSQPSPR